MRQLAVSTLFVIALTSAARADDAALSFQPLANPSGAWGYGWATAPGAAFQAFATHGPAPHLRSAWSYTNGAQISFGCPSYVSNGVTVGGPFINAWTGTSGEAAVLRWTAPATGSYHVNVAYKALGRGLVTPPATSQRYGGLAGAELGRTIAAAGDVNGDGYADVLVGAPYYSGKGRVLLYLGGPDGLATSPAWSYTGATNSVLGISIAAGDVNGDGKPDVVIGAPGFTGPAGAGQGEVLVFLGNGSTFAATPASTILGAAANVQMGNSVAVGDVNGDGYADVLAGSPSESHGQSFEGRAYLWLGSSSGLPASPTTGTAAWSGESNQVNAEYGYSVAVIGDMNGDGKSEIVIGAPYYDTSPSTDGGWIGFYYGSTNGAESIPANTYVINQTNANLGICVAGAGDVDGDGYPDIIAGAPGAGTAGEALVWFGSSLGIPNPPTILAGSQAGEHFGWSVAAAGRVQHGARLGVIVGAENYANGQSFEGGAFYFRGISGGISTTPMWSIESNQANADLGSAVAGVGDVNGDANDDLAIGADSYVQTLTAEGRLTVAYDAGGTPTPYTKVRVGVWKGSTALANKVLDQGAGHDTTFAHFDAALTAGQSLDIVVGGAGGDPAFAAVSLDADVIANPAPVGNQGPFFTLANQRYAGARYGPGFDAVAFDPTRRRYASNGGLYDSCGAQISDGPAGQAITWDMVSLTYWAVAHDNGNARWAFLRYSGATGMFTDTALTIPDRFTVPGIGPDTLEDVRGLALDSTYIYLVDAGPPNLTPPQNEWLKFMRNGTPVSGKKGVAFSVNATGDIVDDIVYCPFSSPTEPGRLLIGIEHTGMDIVDPSGALKETFRWSQQGLAAGHRPTAFAGLSLDPVTGDVFLADNDRTLIERWEHIPSSTATSYLVGTGSSVAYLQTPTDGCSMPLWSSGWASSCGGNTLIFGVAYRNADQRVYGVDYSNGDLWRFDPRSGVAERIGATNVSNIWGLAYDTQRDVLIGHQQGPNQIFDIAPLNAVATMLPLPATYSVSDLAFDPGSHVIYGVDRSTITPRLTRFDRDTGAGTLIGNTRSVVGLDFDANLGALIGVDCCDDTLWQISKTNGAASFLRRRAPGEGWEGLAEIPVGAAPVLAVDPAPELHASPVFSAAPNPWRESVELRFALPAAAAVSLDVFDVAGRRVRRVVSGVLTPGPHVETWDGRDSEGGAARAGVYFARLSVANSQLERTIVRVR